MGIDGRRDAWTWFGIHILLLLGHLLPVPPVCSGEEESKSTTARPQVMVFTRFLPKLTEMLMQEGFSLGAFISGALAEQTERDH